MGVILYHGLRMIQREVVCIAGSFAPAGTGAITAVFGKGFTAARTGVGVFVVTLGSRYQRLQCGVPGQHRSAATNDTLTLGVVSVTPTAANTVQILSNATGGAGVDIAANADNRCHFLLLLNNSAVGL